MERAAYPTDLRDVEWTIVEPLVPAAHPVGHPREVDIREVLNAIFYRTDNGIKWRALPHDFPKWQTVYGYFRAWVRTGVWEKINARLVEQVRLSQGRQAEPSLGMIDSQSVRMAQKGDPTNKELMVSNELRAANVTSW